MPTVTYTETKCSKCGKVERRGLGNYREGQPEEKLSAGWSDGDISLYKPSGLQSVGFDLCPPCTRATLAFLGVPVKRVRKPKAQQVLTQTLIGHRLRTLTDIDEVVSEVVALVTPTFSEPPSSPMPEKVEQVSPCSEPELPTEVPSSIFPRCYRRDEVKAMSQVSHAVAPLTQLPVTVSEEPPKPASVSSVGGDEVDLHGLLPEDFGIDLHKAAASKPKRGRLRKGTESETKPDPATFLVSERFVAPAEQPAEPSWTDYYDEVKGSIEEVRGCLWATGVHHHRVEGDKVTCLAPEEQMRKP